MTAVLPDTIRTQAYIDGEFVDAEDGATFESLAPADNNRPDRKHLVALLPHDRDRFLPEGSQVVDGPTVGAPPVPMLGHVTSSYHSAALERTFALALVKGGRDRIGETVHVPVDGVLVPAEIAEPVVFDKEGARRDG